MVELKGVRTLVPEHAAQTINKPSCLSCPSMLIRDRLMLDAESQRRELQGVAPCPSRITPTRCQFLSNPLSFNLLNRFSVTQTQVCFRQVGPPACRADHSRVKQSEIDHPLRPWHPVAVNLNALVALRRSSWPFVDNSFSFVFFHLFQTRSASRPCLTWDATSPSLATTGPCCAAVWIRSSAVSCPAAGGVDPVGGGSPTHGRALA